jgi:DNA modification methylase
MPEWEIRQGHVLDLLGAMEPESVQCVVTSPPYWGLRDYGLPPQDWTGWSGSLGLESEPELYVDHIVQAFREVRRVLRKDGTLWLNIGDSSTARPAQGGGIDSMTLNRSKRGPRGAGRWGAGSRHAPGLKAKNRVGIPWRVAFALQADGWNLREEIIWAKPNPMPESVKDRPTRAHEQIFLLTRSQRYFYNGDAVRTAAKWPEGPNAAGAIASPHGQGFTRRAKNHSIRPGIDTKGGNQGNGQLTYPLETANLKTVWTIPTRPFPEAHFAVFPKDLPEQCIKAGSRPGDVVLDPFCGSGTTGVVALQLGRRFVGIELSLTYAEMAERRIHNEAGLFSVGVAE